MSKPVKDMIARDLASRYAEQDNVVWVELVGVDGITTNEFRRDLRGRDMKIEIIKTSLFRRAFAEGPLAHLAEVVEGPAALVTGGESAIDVAKVLDEWLPKLHDGLRFRGAVLEGEFLDEARAKGLGKMPSRQDLQARLVGMLLAPGRNVVGAALAPGRNVLGCVKALIKKLEDGEEIKKKSA